MTSLYRSKTRIVLSEPSAMIAIRSRHLRITIVAATFLILSPHETFGQDCIQILGNAEYSFELGRFSDVFLELDNVLEGGCDPDEKVQACRLYALSYLAMDSLSNADNMIRRLLELKMYYETDPRDPPLYVQHVSLVKRQLSDKQISSVSKRAERLELAPATIQIITIDEIRSRGYQHLEEIFHDRPGFDISRSNGITFANLYMRGYRSGTATDRTMLLVDGIEDNELFTNIAYISRQYPLSNLKRVEIIYGPASTMYGSNAFSGVINLDTRDETDAFRDDQPFALHGSVGYGEWQTRFLDMTISGRYNDFFVSATGRVFRSNEMDITSRSALWKYDWLIDGIADETYLSALSTNARMTSLDTLRVYDPGATFYTLRADSSIIPTFKAINTARTLDSIRFMNLPGGGTPHYSDVADDWFVGAKLKHGDITFGFQSWQCQEGSASNFVPTIFAGSLDGNIWAVRQSFLYLNYEKNISSKLNLSNTARYTMQENFPNARQTQFVSYFSKNLHLTDLVKGEKLPSWSTTYFYQQAKQFRTEFRAVYAFSARICVVSGVEYRNSTVQGDYIKSQEPSPEMVGQADTDLPGGNELNVQDFGFFAQLSLKPWQQFHITLDGRVDHNRVRDGGFGTVVTPRIALVYEMEDVIFKAFYSEAFKDASNFQKFSLTSNRLLNNSALKPERVRNMELNIRWTPMPRLITEVSAYNSYYSDIANLQFVPYGLNAIDSTYQYRNMGRLHIYGVQASCEFDFGLLSVYSNYSFTCPFDSEQHKAIGDIAPHHFNCGITVPIYDDNIILNLRMNYTAERPTGSTTTVSTNPLPSIGEYSVVHATLAIQNFGLEHTFLRHTGLQVVFNNIFNRQYVDPGVRTADNVRFASAIPQPGRSMFLSLIIDF